jgi:hypothetical protein
MTDTEKIELLKLKEPAKYKAIAIASLGFFTDEDLVKPFIEQSDKYIQVLSENISDGKVQLKYHLTEEALNIDTLSATLVKDIKDGDSESEMITERIKSLVMRALNALKDSSSKYTEDEEQILVEQCLGYYDQLMILKNISSLADES